MYRAVVDHKNLLRLDSWKMINRVSVKVGVYRI